MTTKSRIRSGDRSRVKSKVRAAVRAAVVAYGAAVSLPALALGLGEIEMQSFLNEPLRAQVELLDTRQLTVDDIRIRLAGVDDFDRLGVERSYFLTSIQFDIEVDETTGRGVIKLSTDDAVLEPFVDLIIEARWPSGRLLREYTVLVDPPTFEQDVVTVSALDRVQQNTDLEKPALAPESQGQLSQGRSQQARTTGDQVAVRESSLPAGQMPSRAFSAETVNVPRSGNRYMVKRDETLWQIASQGKPGDISVQQAMLEIQRLNPEAFINGNINQIKAGYIIYLPAAGEISSDDLALALDEVREQNQEWREGRGAPGVTAAATLRVSADSSAETRRARSDADSSQETQASSAGRPSSAGATRSDSPVSEQPASAMADASAGSSELAAQLSDMASRLDTLEQIVSLKDQQIATLEQALREAREAAANAAAAAPAVAQSAAPTRPPAVTPAAAGSSQSSSGGIPWLPISGGLLAIVAGVVLLLRRRAKNDAATEGYSATAKPAEDDVFAGVNLTEETFDPEESEAPVKATEDVLEIEADSTEELQPETAPVSTVDEKDEEAAEADSRGGSRGYGERKHDDYIDEGAAGDALAEADIYIAYGRYLQAIELLDTAIASDPANSAYRLKLIELYVDMGEEASAAEQLDALREHGDASAITRGEALVGGAAAAATAASSLDLDAAQEPAELSLSDGLELDADNELSLPDEPETMELGDTLELSLDDAAIDQPVVGDTGGSDAELDDDIESIEFEHLEIEEDAVMDADSELDFATAEEELDLSDALVFAEDEPSDDVAPEAAEADTEELLIADDADQMATKLDLARAYMDMGDSEGARGILEEVVAKGTEEQQQESRDLLTRIG